MQAVWPLAKPTANATMADNDKRRISIAEVDKIFWQRRDSARQDSRAEPFGRGVVHFLESFESKRPGGEDKAKRVRDKRKLWRYQRMEMKGSS